MATVQRGASLPVDAGRYLGVVLMGGLGIATLSIHLVHAMTVQDALAFVLLNSVVVPMLLSVLLLAVAAWLVGTTVDDRASDIGAWSVVGAVVLFAMSLQVITYQESSGGAIIDPLYVIANHTTSGALLGVVLGVYDLRRRRSERRARTDRERAERLSRRLTVLNRVLRHDLRQAVTVIRGNAELLLNGAQDVDGAAATIRERADDLCEQSDRAREIEAVLGSDTTATERVDVAAVVRRELAPFEADSGVEVTVDLPDAAWATAHPMFASAVGDVVQNAVEHNDAATPQVEVTVERAGGWSGCASPTTAPASRRPSGPSSSGATRRPSNTRAVSASGSPTGSSGSPTERSSSRRTTRAEAS
jgi:signal transduction histidine kinase